MDAKTKTILKTWPLTTVRRWAAAPNVFTLDFDDYQDQYYAVQTTEGWLSVYFSMYLSLSIYELPFTLTTLGQLAEATNVFMVDVGDYLDHL